MLEGNSSPAASARAPPDTASRILTKSCVSGWAPNPSLALSVRRVQRAPLESPPRRAWRIEPYVGRELPGGPQVTIRHAYPPDWTPPPNGLWVHVQPWEFGHLPTSWLDPLKNRVDEVWAPSQYVRRVYERSGVPPEKIQVIPWGFDPEVFSPGATPLLLPTAKTFRFLYVGGTIPRKGFDRVLDAYLTEFRPEEDVCLVVKDICADTLYRHNNFREQVLAASRDNSRPAIPITMSSTPGQLASLYTACQFSGVALPRRRIRAADPRGDGVRTAAHRGRHGVHQTISSRRRQALLPGREQEVESELELCGPHLELAICQTSIYADAKRTSVVKSRWPRARRPPRAARLLHVAGGLRGWPNGSCLPTARLSHLPHTRCDHVAAQMRNDIDQRSSIRGVTRPLRARWPECGPTLIISSVRLRQGLSRSQPWRRNMPPRLLPQDDHLVRLLTPLPPCGWLLRLNGGERPGEEGMEQLGQFLASLPSTTTAVAAQIRFAGLDGRCYHQQADVRLRRRNDAVGAIIADDFEYVGNGEAGRLAPSPLEITVPLAIAGGQAGFDGPETCRSLASWSWGSRRAGRRRRGQTGSRRKRAGGEVADARPATISPVNRNVVLRFSRAGALARSTPRTSPIRSTGGRRSVTPRAS